MKRTDNKKMKKAVLLVGTTLLLGVTGIGAYFTATDTVTNIFNIEKVDVQLTEPTYVDGQDVAPNKTITKDPTVTNIGTADAFVFLSVKVPYKNIITANADGTRNAATNVELFAWNYDPSTTEAELTAGDAAANMVKGLGNGAVNVGWTLVKTNDLTTEGVVEYIYAYGSDTEMTTLVPTASTSALFDSVTMCNAIDGQGLENTDVEITYDVYAIQASDLGESGNGTVVPTEVLEIYLTQNK